MLLCCVTEIHYKSRAWSNFLCSILLAFNHHCRRRRRRRRRRKYYIPKKKTKRKTTTEKLKALLAQLSICCWMMRLNSREAVRVRRYSWRKGKWIRQTDWSWLYFKEIRHNQLKGNVWLCSREEVVHSIFERERTRNFKRTRCGGFQTGRASGFTCQPTDGPTDHPLLSSLSFLI